MIESLVDPAQIETEIVGGVVDSDRRQLAGGLGIEAGPAGDIEIGLNRNRRER